MEIKQKRISSLTTIWFAWILPILTLIFWTPVTIVVLWDGFSDGLSGYLLVATILILIIYLTIKPWKLKTISENDIGILIKSSKENIQIPYDDIKKVKPLFSFRLTPVTIEYIEKGKLKKVNYISRLTSPLFTLAS